MKMISLKPFLIFCAYFLLAISFGLEAQETKTIEIKDAGAFNRDEIQFPGANILSKNDSKRVHLFHEGMDVWSDRAIFYKQRNFFKAYGNVVVNQGDTIEMYSNYIEYDGNKRFATTKENVVLKNPEMSLETDTLYYNRNDEIAFYETWGIVKDSASVIKSDRGRFYMKQKKYRFLTNVDITNPEYDINSLQLDYYTDTDHAYFYGPTTIKGEDYDIYCERGFYDTQNKKGFFIKNSEILYNNRIIEGDSLYFNNAKKYAAATNNIKLTDTVNNSVIVGHYAEIFKAKDSAMITRNPIAISLVETDSLYVHADTLIATGPPEKRIIKGFFDVRLYKKDLSGKADSIHINKETGLTKLLRKPISKRQLQRLTPKEISQKNPVLWSGASQMTGDVIHLISNVETEELDSLKILNNAFVVEKDTLGINNYNQIKGINLFGKFIDNTLKTIHVVKNTEMIYYLYDDDTQDLIGIDKSICSAIQMDIVENAIDQITYFTEPEGSVYPEKELPANARQLRGFVWRGKEKVSSKEDLLSEEDKRLVLVAIRGIKNSFDPNEKDTTPEILKSNRNPVKSLKKEAPSSKAKDTNLKKKKRRKSLMSQSKSKTIEK